MNNLLERLMAAKGRDDLLNAEIALYERWHPYGPFHWINKSPEYLFEHSRSDRDGWISIRAPDEDEPRDSFEAPDYTGSIDAAAAFVNRRLPGRFCKVSWGTNGSGNKGSLCWIWDSNVLSSDNDPIYAATVPLAILTAFFTIDGQEPKHNESAGRPPKRWRSWRVCPACGSKATKILSINSGKYRCQVCDHEYDPPEKPND